MITSDGLGLAQQVAIVAEKMRDTPRIRLGQSLFNATHELRPDLANKVRGSDLDPFYNDGRAGAFLAWLAKKAI